MVQLLAFFLAHNANLTILAARPYSLVPIPPAFGIFPFSCCCSCTGQRESGSLIPSSPSRASTWFRKKDRGIGLNWIHLGVQNLASSALSCTEPIECSCIASVARLKFTKSIEMWWQLGGGSAYPNTFCSLHFMVDTFRSKFKQDAKE